MERTFQPFDAAPQLCHDLPHDLQNPITSKRLPFRSDLLMLGDPNAVPDRDRTLALCWREIRGGKFREALQLCEELNRQNPGNAEAWHARSYLKLMTGDVSHALEYIERALELAPGNNNFIVQKATSLIAANRRQDAINVLLIAIRGESPTVTFLSQAAALLSRLDEDEAALAGLHQAVSIAPSQASLHYNLAAVQRFRGDLAQAEASYDRVIELRPTDYEAYLIRATIRRQSTNRNHTTQLEQMLRTGDIPWLGMVQLHYAAAKEYEDIEQYDQSFDHLYRGASLRRHHIQYDLNEDLQVLSKIIEVFGAQLVQQNDRDSVNESPIFIVGMPRTGSTLLEKILGGHSNLFAAGELQLFPREMMKGLQSVATSKHVSRMRLIEFAPRLDFVALGRAYIHSARARLGHAMRFIDKLPLNFLNCGMICRALPRSKIIHITRHPIATCYAMYKTLFKLAYPFSYDMQELGRYYAAYSRLMSHWNQLAPEKILNVSYESLITSTESTVRRVLEFCELPWEATCLDFRSHIKSTKTASASQVRMPIYTTSLDQWRFYESKLDVLRETLVGNGVSDVC